jgi:hypothetical protein
MNVIVYTSAAGTRAILAPNYELQEEGESDSDFLARIQAKDVPAGATDIQVMDAADVPPEAPTTAETLAAKLAAGLAVTSTGTPSLSATYALDTTTLDQIRALATDAKAGLGFPGGETAFAYPDASGTPRTFDATSIVNLYKALRDYVFALKTTAATLDAGGPAEWPLATATIA